VVNLETRQVLQNLAAGQPHGKAVLSVDGRRLFVPQGTEGNVVVYDVDEEGTLTQTASIDVGERVVALRAAADGQTLWAAMFSGSGARSA
jgi:hypothetical protein